MHDNETDNGMKGKRIARQNHADMCADKRADRTDKEQLAELDKRPGNAKKERERLNNE